MCNRLYCQDGPCKGVQCQIVLRLAFPDGEDVPSEDLQPFDYRCISGHVCREFCLPEIRASGGRCCIWTSRVLMPETAVHKYRYLASRQDEVRATRKGSVMETKPQSGGMKISPHPKFWLGVASMDGAHHPRSDFRRDRVGQVQLLMTLFSVRRAIPLSDLVVFRPIHQRTLPGFDQTKR